MNSVNGCGVRRAALINDLSCFGKCSLSVAMPIISSYAVETVPLPTAVLSTHTAGFPGYILRDMTSEMRTFSNHWKTLGIKFDAIYTGFLCSVEQLRFARSFIKDFCSEETIVVVDPVLGDNGSLYGCFTPDFVDEMRKLTGLADIITPNRTEAALLSGMPMDTPEEELLSMLPGNIRIITSAGGKGETGYLAALPSGTVRLTRELLPISLHGAGDVFTSALTGEILSGKTPEAALREAADFCDRCIRDTADRQPAHWYGLWFEDELARRKA